MNNLRAKAMILSFIKGAPIPPNDLAREIVVTMTSIGLSGFGWRVL